MTPPPRDPARKADVSVVTPYAKTMLAASKRAECAAKGEKAKDSQFKFHWISLKRTINIRFLVYFGNPEKHIYIYTDWYLDVGNLRLRRVVLRMASRTPRPRTPNPARQRQRRRLRLRNSPRPPSQSLPFLHQNLRPKSHRQIMEKLKGVL